MKFSASIKPEYFETFSNVIAAQNKLSDKLCFILENKTIKICSIEKDRTLSSFCDINPNVFNSIQIESKNHNQISLQISGTQLLKVLLGSKNAVEIIMKLTSKHGPCLTFEIKLDIAIVEQEIPISLISGDQLDYYQEPEVAIPQLKLRMNVLKELKEVLNRMKVTSNILFIYANSSGEMEIVCKSATVVMKTSFHDIQVMDPPSTMVHLYMRVDRLALYNTLSCIESEPKAVILCFNNSALIVLVVLKNNMGRLTYYIPAQLLVEGEDVYLLFCLQRNK